MPRPGGSLEEMQENLVCGETLSDYHLISDMGQAVSRGSLKTQHPRDTLQSDRKKSVQMDCSGTLDWDNGPSPMLPVSRVLNKYFDYHVVGVRLVETDSELALASSEVGINLAVGGRMLGEETSAQPITKVVYRAYSIIPVPISIATLAGLVQVSLLATPST
ncbi:hypothetical protein DUI87_03628 [Hirundo rustica rustica]|uniref:Uncharacterized protein n=1 Tax=Hirundo rustica rustica TaxID=333673 RepID=A0A3M0L539_HIRRU|nr:hypothetical protein DUI87_03628 [Hirundo rustica rustica]